EVAAGDVRVLAKLEHHNSDACVLAERHHLAPGDLGVLDDLVQHQQPERRRLAGARGLERVFYVRGQVMRRLDAEARYSLGDRRSIDVPHGRVPSSYWIRPSSSLTASAAFSMPLRSSAESSGCRISSMPSAPSRAITPTNASLIPNSPWR